MGMERGRKGKRESRRGDEERAEAEKEREGRGRVSW